MANITVGAARFMVSDVAGARPSKNPNSKSALRPRQVFLNVTDAVMCVGTVGGDHIELDFRNAAGLPGMPGPEGPPGPPGEVDSIEDIPGLPDVLDEKVSRGVTPVFNSNYNCLSTDVQVVMRTLEVTRSIYLPDVDSYPFGQDLVIFDESGNCSPNVPILIYPGIGTNDTIAGVESFIILEQPYFPLRFRRGTVNLWVRTP